MIGNAMMRRGDRVLLWNLKFAINVQATGDCRVCPPPCCGPFEFDRNPAIKTVNYVDA
jgi:hypothetical protein